MVHIRIFKAFTQTADRYTLHDLYVRDAIVFYIEFFWFLAFFYTVILRPSSGPAKVFPWIQYGMRNWHMILTFIVATCHFVHVFCRDSYEEIEEEVPVNRRKIVPGGIFRCLICMEEMKKNGPKLNAELACKKKHKFHEDCLRKWVQLKAYCAVCNETVIK